MSNVDFVSSPRVRGFRCSVGFGGFLAIALNHLRMCAGHFGEANPPAIAHSVRGSEGLPWGGSQAKGLDNGVMHGGAHGSDLFVRARGIDAVGEKDNEKLPVRVNPDRRAGKTQMAEAARGKVTAAGGIRRGNHPSKRARVGRECLRSDELRERRASQQALVRVAASIEKHLAERREVRRRREHPRVSGYAAHGERIFVVNLSPKQALAKYRIVLRGSDAADERLRRIKP